MPVRSTFAALASAITIALAATASAQVPSPTIEGPITGPGSPFIASTTFDLAQVCKSPGRLYGATVRASPSREVGLRKSLSSRSR